MAAKRQTIESTVSYTGSAVSFVDQDVYPRVTGWITWMPFYPGDRVRKGQLLAMIRGWGRWYPRSERED